MMNRLTASASGRYILLHGYGYRVAPFLLLLPSSSARLYATQQPSRRSVTPFNDDGRVPWTDLSAREKTGRAAQQTFNFGMVIVGVVLTGGVGYLLYQEVFSPDSKTAYFNRAVDRIKADARCVELLGDGRKITAYGEETFNKWRRARPIAYAPLLPFLYPWILRDTLCLVLGLWGFQGVWL
jgi:hypothetical protein